MFYHELKWVLKNKDAYLFTEGAFKAPKHFDNIINPDLVFKR